MKKITSFIPLLFGVALLSFNLSCSKSNEANPSGDNDNGNNNNTNGYYMKFKVDGVQKDFRSGTEATLTNNSPGSNGNYQAIMVSFKDISGAGAANAMSLGITTTIPIVVNKKYSDNSQFGLTGEAMIIYFNELGTPYYSLNPDLVPNTSLNITLSQITSTNLKGTFSGRVYGNSTSDFHQITEGTFNLPVK